MNKPSRGFTLIELVVTISIAAIIATAAVPMISDYNTNARLREAGNSLLAETLYAQSEAIKRNTNVSLSVTSSLVRVIDVEKDQTLRQREMPTGVTASPAEITFGGAGRPAQFGAGANVDLSMTNGTCSNQYRCPRLIIDGGGSVRLFSNKLDASGL